MLNISRNSQSFHYFCRGRVEIKWRALKGNHEQIRTLKAYASLSTSGLRNGMPSKFVWLQDRATIRICLSLRPIHHPDFLTPLESCRLACYLEDEAFIS
jgi:hypothetical protein